MTEMRFMPRLVPHLMPRLVPRVTPQRRRAAAGMTLIEIMIVIAIAALMVTGAAMGLGALTRSHLRAGSMTVSAAARFAYHRAVSHGNTVRIALDFEAGTLGLEEAHGQVVLANPDADDSLDEDVDDDGARDPWAAARSRLDDTLHANIGRASFSTIADADGEAIDRFAPRPFDGVTVHMLISPHEREPREDGKGYVYFFPSGRTEHTVVQLINENGTVYSIEIDGLTGRTQVHPFAFGEEDLVAFELRDPG